ncbi:MAG: hypothetical protein RLZZ265_2179 [Verrucomicrobiota bacterium]|jgi:hypothetical protein
MNTKMDRQQQRVAKKLAMELQTHRRSPGVLLRLCRWEQRRQRSNSITRHYLRD